eukprot:1177346-Prorocentrum_minimum.AAC.4
MDATKPWMYLIGEPNMDVEEAVDAPLQDPANRSQGTPKREALYREQKNMVLGGGGCGSTRSHTAQ